MAGKYIDRRKSERLEIRGLIADISDKTGFYSGHIEDVSLDGVKITLLLKKFEVEPRQYITVVSGYNKNFKIKVQPCWHNQVSNGYYQEVGFRIIEPSWAWASFIQGMLPDEVEDNSDSQN